MKKNVKGITLVSLVITIIVMLILAGVSISMATGNNGVLTQGKKASTNTTLGTIESDITLAGTGVMSSYWGEFAESTSKAGSKATYIKPENLNEQLNECYFLNGGTAAKDITISGAKIQKKAHDSESSVNNIQSTALSTMAGVKKGESDKTGTGLISKVGYVCNCFYFSNGVNQTTAGGDLYVVLVHFDNEGEMFVDDVGVAQATASVDLYQGELANTDNLEKLKSLDVQWLKDVADQNK